MPVPCSGSAESNGEGRERFGKLRPGGLGFGWARAESRLLGLGFQKLGALGAEDRFTKTHPKLPKPKP